MGGEGGLISGLQSSLQNKGKEEDKKLLSQSRRGKDDLGGIVKPTTQGQSVTLSDVNIY